MVTVSHGIDDDTVGVIAPSPSELFAEANGNSVQILLAYGAARVLLVDDADAREEYVATPTGRTHPAMPCGLS